MTLSPGEILLTRFESWYQQLLENVPNLIAAILAIVIFYGASRLLRKYIYKIVGKTVKRGSLKRLTTAFIQTAITLVGILIALNVLNLGKVITSILAGAGVAGLIIGFAMQEIISNYFSGVTIASTEPFSIGDLVEVNKILGIVRRINVRTTEINTADGQLVEIPNKDVINNPITNYTVTKERRIEIRSGISYEDDMEKARKVALEAVKDIEGISKNKPIEFFYEEFGESALNFVLRFWMDFGNSQIEYYELKSKAIERLLKAFGENDITMPYPTQTIKLER